MVNISEQLNLGQDNPISKQQEFSSIGGFIGSILPNIYIIAGIILFIVFFIAGIYYIANAGKGDQKATEAGQKAITAAIIGLVIIFTSWWIIKIIEIVTGINIFNPNL